MFGVKEVHNIEVISTMISNNGTIIRIIRTSKGNYNNHNPNKIDLKRAGRVGKNCETKLAVNSVLSNIE